MRFVVVSDSHGDREILVQLVAHYQDQAVTMLHCGDSELATDDPLFTHMTVVQGNMDFNGQFPAKTTFSVDNQRVFLTHGHLYGVNTDLTHLLLAAQEVHANLACYGHTHQLDCEMHAGVLLLNPGSIAQPRGPFRNLKGTYAVIDVTPDQYHVQYYNRQFIPVSQLQLTFQRT
ncbi:metallophosphoesterase family protein [Latilactobacillus graminis]|uniref:Phosphoesterase n=2 Tax=Latilactobacillus graminis TaxID=60519 RepID=A0AA89I296_9LACO|nr:metallophosphoesterase [Latilactobacillus graminis]KRM24411.1 phosphodiesterase, MJ0936 family protein [Latilactobacillus graminis DSM 20719]QFP80039.1 metallophosphoesterase [Latilactobacillus graminis]